MVPRQIFSALKDEILSGALHPGAELIQEELAARFGASRIPVREALRLLEAEELVTIGPNRGARVISLSPAEVAEIFHLRLLLESDCLAAAVPRMSEADLARIDHALRRAEVDARTTAWAESDLAFHEALYLPAGRPRQVRLIRRLRATSELYGPAHGALPGATGTWLADHHRIVEACHAGQARQAVAALRAHLEGAREVVLAAMRGG